MDLTNTVASLFFSQIENAPMRLQLWDTAGQERFRSLTSNFFGRADGFVLTYDISNRPSFDHVIGWMRDIKTRAPSDCDIVLCGNKSDLDNDRVVSFDEGKQLADEYGVQFFETSALTGQNVEKMFTSLATTIKHKRIDEFEQANSANASGGTPLRTAGSADHGGSTGGDSRKTIQLGAGASGNQHDGAANKPGCC
jgi:small GTP-binding protein